MGKSIGEDMMEKSFVMLKPDAVSRKLIGKILSRFEEKGLKIVGIKLLQITEDLAKTHYGEHEGKPFFNDLVNYIISAPSLAMVIEGDEAITVIRKIVGATNPKEADLGTIRGDYAMDTGRNIIHASDSPKSAEIEINLFFNQDEICDYEGPDNSWVYEPTFLNKR
jgi:nucleoside-diphosphate kinase